MKITSPNNCDNSPKMRILRDALIDLYKGDFDDFLKNVDDTFVYHRIDKPTIHTKADLKDHLKKQGKLKILSINQVLSHGKLGACNGHFEDAKGITHFAYFFEFKSAGSNLIKTITLYQI